MYEIFNVRQWAESPAPLSTLPFFRSWQATWSIFLHSQPFLLPFSTILIMNLLEKDGTIFVQLAVFFLLKTHVFKMNRPRWIKHRFQTVPTDKHLFFSFYLSFQNMSWKGSRSSTNMAPFFKTCPVFRFLSPKRVSFLFDYTWQAPFRN